MKKDEVELQDEEMDEEGDEEGNEEMTEENIGIAVPPAIVSEADNILQTLLNGGVSYLEANKMNIINLITAIANLNLGNESKSIWSSASSPALLPPPPQVQSSSASALIDSCVDRLNSLAPSAEFAVLRQELLTLRDTLALRPLTPEETQRLQGISEQLSEQEHKVSVSSGSR